MLSLPVRLPGTAGMALLLLLTSIALVLAILVLHVLGRRRRRARKKVGSPVPATSPRPAARPAARPQVPPSRLPAVAGALVLGAAMAALLPAPSPAADLGTRGPLHPIAEPDLLVEITQTLQAKQASGEIARLQAQAQQRALASIQNPPAVTGLRRTTQPRSYLYDPSIRFDDAVLDASGRVIVAAGTVANPLSVVQWRRELLLFDGRDAAQVDMAHARLALLGDALKPVLVAGSPVDLMRAWKRPVYFDQGGTLVRKFGISQVPARVRQDGLQLRIEEFKP